MIRNRILNDLKNALKKLGLPTKDIHLEHPAIPEHGDYATNVALQLAKTKWGKHWRSPLELAREIAKLTQNYAQDYGQVTVEEPGFINFTLTPKTLVALLAQILKEGGGFGKGDWGKGKTVVIDYSSPNIARSFGIGHLRSTIIGQALYNIYQFLGWRCIGDNHIGDWGTQFGKLIFMIKRENLDPNKLTIADLERLYVQFHRKAEKNPRLEEKGREWFRRLERKDPEARRIWQACVTLSLKEFERIYKLLEIKIDYTLGESFYQEKMTEVIADARKKGIAKESKGALVIKIPGLSVPLMLLKSDGATTYETRDLATIKFRREKWHPDLYIYEVGAEQRLHFKKVFGAAVLLGYGKREQFVHVAHGLFLDKTGKFSTRKGRTVHLEDVLKEAVERAKKLAQIAGISKSLSSREQEEVAKAVGIGGVKYNDLKQNPERDVIFDWDKILSLEGNSGPYLQYTYARAKSVLAKAQKLPTLSYQLSVVNPEELALLRTLYRFPEVVEEAGKNYAPNLICSFLFDLAKKFNLFYDHWRIIGDPREEIRLSLTSATAQVLKNGLLLLGIKPLEKM